MAVLHQPPPSLSRRVAFRVVYEVALCVGWTQHYLAQWFKRLIPWGALAWPLMTVIFVLWLPFRLVFLAILPLAVALYPGNA